MSKNCHYLKFFIFILLLFFVFGCSGKHHPVTSLKGIEKQEQKILFLAIDGIGYEMMKELKEEGYFKDFGDPAPFVVTFPSATTLSFSGMFKQLGAGKVYGPESRFYSYEANKIVGGTPLDMKKYPIPYKSYFDSFRHTVYEKSIMYSFPGVAGRQDLLKTKKLLLKSDKKILFSYLGGTDGGQHMLGKERTKRFMKYADGLIQEIKNQYNKTHSDPLQIVIFSDHGFSFGKLKMIWGQKINKVLKKEGYRVANRLQNMKDVVLVRYGLLNGGVLITQPGNEARVGSLLKDVEGMDLVFWGQGDRVYVINSKGEEAYFQYQGIIKNNQPQSGVEGEAPSGFAPQALPSVASGGGDASPLNKYRYVVQNGDPLEYVSVLRKNHFNQGQWISDNTWLNITVNHRYPDVGHRVYDTFYNLVENVPSVLFSLKPGYQFGSLAAFAGTQLKPGGHKATHGGIFKEVTEGVVITDDLKRKLPGVVRYDQLFDLFIPKITHAYRRSNFSH